MANQKVYNIVINGVKESITNVDVLINQLDKLEKKLSNLGKSGIKIDTKDLEKIKIPEINIDKINAKGLQKEMKALEKDIAKGAKTIDGEYTNTLNGLRAQLRDLKAELGQLDLDVDADAFADLTQEINDLNTRVKEMEQDYGTFSRNVGNYTDSMVDALNEFDGQMYETAGGIEEVAQKVDSLKGKQLFEVNLGGTVVQFENISQAIGEIDDMAHATAARMQELRNAGKQNTEEYKKLNAEFQEFIQQSAELERVRKQTDELRDSIASSTRGLDMGVQAFQALGNAMQMASGIAGLFGQNQEEIEKAINRTVQIMGIMQAAQELYQQTVQKGTVLNILYSNTFGKINQGLTRMVSGLNLGTKATKALNTVLKANIFVAIASAILYVVTNLDKLSEILGITSEETKTFTKLWEKISPVIMGVGRVVTDSLINPIRTLVKTMAELIDGDFKGALEELGKGFKEQFNVIEDYQKGYTDEVIRQQENVTKKQKIELDKQLLNEIDYNEAKNGSDWKYTQKGTELYRKYFANKLLMYSKDSEEYRQALLEQLRFERELKEHQENGDSSNGGSSSGSGKSKLDIKREIEDATIALMEEGYLKEREILLKQQEREIEDNAKHEKLKKALIEKAIKEQQDLWIKHNDEVLAARKQLNDEILKMERESNNILFDNQLANQEFKLDNYNKILEGNTYKQTDYKTKIQDVTDIVFNYGASSDIEGDMRKSLMTLESLQKQYAQDIQIITARMNETLSDKYREYYSMLLESAKQHNEDFEKIATDYNGYYIGIVNQRIVTERDVLAQAHAEELIALQEWYEEKDKAERENEKRRLELVGDNGDARMKVMEESNEILIQIEEEYEKKKFALTLDYTNRIKQIEIDANKERSNIISNHNDIVYNAYREHYEEIQKLREEYSNIDDVNIGSFDLTNIGIFGVQILEMKTFKNEFKNTLDDIAKQKQELQKQFDDGVIGDDVFNKQINELNVLESETKQSLKEIEMSWKDWAVGVANVTSAVVNIWAQMYSQIADLQYQNEMHRIEKLQEQYDEETELLEEKLAEQEELYERHNQNVESIEGELETARGDRRLFLLDQINSEMMKREQAWAQQQKIAKQQEQLEKKKEALEQRQKAAEQKRNKQNQKVQIAQATASTALAVTNALAVQPWFVGVALAAVAAAMGAVQIATIAKQKFADGGVIQGASHAQGGVKVLGGTAEVEGGEYITNKVTTSKNVDVLSYINSKKKKLDLSDFIEFYSTSKTSYNKPAKTIFADGGQLPNMSAPEINVRDVINSGNQDNRPIYVSVTEIENVQNKVRNVRAVAGLDY